MSDDLSPVSAQRDRGVMLNVFSIHAHVLNAPSYHAGIETGVCVRLKGVVQPKMKMVLHEKQEIVYWDNCSLKYLN